MEQDSEFAEIMKEANELMLKYMNNNVIDEIHKMNNIEKELGYLNQEVQSMTFSDDLFFGVRRFE